VFIQRLFLAASLLLLISCTGRPTGEDKTAEDKKEASKALKHQSAFSEFNTPSGPIGLKVFLQNTPGMDGFSYKGGRFADNVYAFVNDLNDPSVGLVKQARYYLLFSDQKVVPVPNEAYGFSRELFSITAAKRRANGVRSHEVDFSRLLKTVVDSALASTNAVSVLATNMVFRTNVGNPNDMEKHLAMQQQDIRAALKNIRGLAIVILRDTATYKIKERDGALHTGYERPYYVLMVGRPGPLWSLIKKLDLGKRSTNKVWLQSMPSQTATLKTAVVSGHPWGDKYAAERNADKQNYVIDAEPSRDNKGFTFVAQADLDALGPFADLARQPDAWRVEPEAFQVQRIGPEKRYNIEPGFTDFISVGQKGNLVLGQVTLVLPYKIPGWVSQLSYGDYQGLRYETRYARGKSFGLLQIVEGISNAMGNSMGNTKKDIATTTFTIAR